MLLRSVRLRNFRGVKSAGISLDPTTVLIGENDCGRTSILEAVALALGWKSAGPEFRFQPYHLHRPDGAESGSPAIAIGLEFRETAAGEWNGSGFELLRKWLPEGVGRERRFWFEVTHEAAGANHWTFRFTHGKILAGDASMLSWLRRRVPVVWVHEGMADASDSDSPPGYWADDSARQLAGEVIREYRELLQGKAVDIASAIERGAAAAGRLLDTRMKLPAASTTLFREVLEEIKGERNPRFSSTERNPGMGAQNIGVLLLVGALLRSGAGEIEEGLDPLTLIENPEAHLHPMTLASLWGVMERIGGQKVIATHSGSLLSRARLPSVRRLTRHAGFVKEWRVPEGGLTADELRRHSYHVRSRRAEASFARCWLLVEGETEFWLMSEFGRVLGYDLASEGVACVEFAQCGLDVLIKVARYLGIEWHMLVDGDAAGQQYARAAGKWADTQSAGSRITMLDDADIEHCFWRHGYAQVFREAAYPGGAADKNVSPKRAIARAIERYSKPYVAALLLDAVIGRGPGGVPAPVRRVIEACVGLARRAMS
jgi:putative ATP-dependent endonuclease of OLD family